MRPVIERKGNWLFVRNPQRTVIKSCINLNLTARIRLEDLEGKPSLIFYSDMKRSKPTEYYSINFATADEASKVLQECFYEYIEDFVKIDV